MQASLRRHGGRIALSVALATTALLGHAQKAYDTGATDKEIKIGNISPYSGPASTYGAMGKAIRAYFEKVNAEGGINGRQIKFLSLDDGYNPAKTVEQARKLVEQDGVLLIMSPMGTAPNMAIHKYMNQKKVPQLFVSSGASAWNDPKNYPWTMGWQPSQEIEGSIYGKHILETTPKAKVAVLYQNDDFGKNYLKGLKAGLGAAAKNAVVAEASFEVTDPSVDSQVVSLKASGADTIVYFAPPKQAAQAIKKVGDLAWKPAQYIATVSSQIESVLKPAGADYAKGIISIAYLKEPGDTQWHGTPEYQDWLAWMKKYNPEASTMDINYVYGYSQAQLMVYVLKNSGDNLTRANVMKQAAAINTTLPMLLPGVTLKTSADDFALIKRLRLMVFDGKTWELTAKAYGG